MKKNRKKKSDDAGSVRYQSDKERAGYGCKASSEAFKSGIIETKKPNKLDTHPICS